jgi:hypothetical protein
MMEAIVLKRILDAVMTGNANVIIADDRLWAALDDCWATLQRAGIAVEPPAALCEHLRAYFRAPHIHLDVIIEGLLPLLKGAPRDVVTAARGSNSHLACWIGLAHLGLIEGIQAILEKANGVTLDRHVAVTENVGRELDRLVPLILAEQHWIILSSAPVTAVLAQMIDDYAVPQDEESWRAALSPLPLDLFVIGRRHLSLRALHAYLARYLGECAPTATQLTETPLIAFATADVAPVVDGLKDALRVKLEEQLMGARQTRANRAQARSNN